MGAINPALAHSLPGPGMVSPQGMEKAVTGGEQEDAHRQTGGERRGAQRLKTPGQQQGCRHRPFRDHPEDALRRRWVRVAARGHHVIHQRAAVGRCDKEHKGE
jgi:hypothetical protein